jgi:hypothetical protein
MGKPIIRVLAIFLKPDDAWILLVVKYLLCFSIPDGLGVKPGPLLVCSLAKAPFFSTSF